jgi:hypothetical protein
MHYEQSSCVACRINAHLIGGSIISSTVSFSLCVPHTTMVWSTAPILGEHSRQYQSIYYLQTTQPKHLQQQYDLITHQTNPYM